jgi:predicted RNase H-like nuclease (RuvC/YqgF family)
MNDKFNVLYVVLLFVIIVLINILIFTPKDTASFDYERIENNYLISIKQLKQQIDSVATLNKDLMLKLEDLKSSIPNRKKELLQINNEIKKINELYKNTNYRDSTDVALIQRLSR